MLVCICRNISSNDYSELKKLLARLKEKDLVCEKCLSKRGLNELRKLYEVDE